MQILFVSHYYFSIGGVETQMRLVAHELARRHEVTVAAGSLLSTHGTPASLPPAASTRASVRKFLKERLAAGVVALKRRIDPVLDESFKLPRPHQVRVDGPISVHAVVPGQVARVKLFAAALRLILGRDRDREHLERVKDHVYRQDYVAQLTRLITPRTVVHCTAHSRLGWAAQEAARARRAAFVVSTYVHPGQYGDDARNVAFYTRADAVFALHEPARDILVDLGVPRELIRIGGVVPLLPDSVSPHEFRLRHGLGSDPIVLFLGRLLPYKGFEALLESAALVWSEMPQVRFVFAGPADAQSHAAFHRHRDARIHDLGLVSDQEKGDALAACDLFCMPSVGEVLPAVYLEAWSYRKPVLGGTAPGLRELIEGNGGGLVVEQHPGAIARRIVGLLRDEGQRRRMGERGHALVQQRFSTAALVRAYEAVYDDVSTQKTAKTFAPIAT